jgi:hypothetical protein
MLKQKISVDITVQKTCAQTFDDNNLEAKLAIPISPQLKKHMTLNASFVSPGLNFAFLFNVNIDPTND